MKKFLPYYFVVYITILMMLYPENSIFYARRSMDMCCEIIIPSLFPFFVCSGLLVYSGFAESLSRLCRPIMQPLFNINGSGAAAFILGIISGYPLGAITACQLYDASYLSKSETERLLAFCNNSGPLFILGAVGAAVYHSPKIGVILYTSHIAAALTVGILFRFYARGRHSAPVSALRQPKKEFSEVFSEVLSASISSILTVCAAVIFFGVISNIFIDRISSGGVFRAIFLGISELTSGVSGISQLSLSLSLKLILSAFIVGFAGLCVHLQVMSVAAKRMLSLKPYILGKLLHGFFAALYVWIILRLVPITEYTFGRSAPTMSGGFCISSLYSAVTVVFFVSLLGFISLFGMFGVKKVLSAHLRS